ncbi:MAG: ABC transporter permease [Lachnospiraceae bacterium]|nr:ABC transporter permease [Lachnospiraceae bacterium]
MWTTITEFVDRYHQLLLDGIRDTLVMTITSFFFAYVLGLFLGVLLVISKPHGIRPNRACNVIVGWIVNIGRAIPFIILMISIMPLTKAIMGTKLGVKGAIFPLIVSAAPFVARMVETSLSEIDAGVIEASQAMGATTWQIIRKVYLPESLPSLILGGSVSFVTIFAYTTMAGAVGAGGLGDIAIRYGYNRYEADVLWVTVVLLILLVEIAQAIFNWLSRKTDRRIRR